MQASLYADGRKLCEDFEIVSEWQPPKQYGKRFMGSVNNGYMKLPSVVEGVAGNCYDFVVVFEGDLVITLFKGLLVKTASGINYIEIVSDITEEEL